MGEVFLAQDLALGRAAAIKVLPRDFSPELRVRLLREAEASRRLQHPGIATFYEAGEAGTRAFIAMEYVRGQTLRQRLRAGSLLPGEAIPLIVGLLEALGHAHAAGIIHRDIKPENVMVTEAGAAKLLDFGLAAPALGDPSAETMTEAARTLVTEPGMLVGSIGYMAPEQLRNEGADARSDLFAVGAVLYEMLAGRPAFGGANAPARISATLFAEPPALDPSLGDLRSIVERALAKSPAERYADASEFLRDLRRLDEGQRVASHVDTIAVLDFVNRSADPADDWIGGGIAESVVLDLGRHAGLQVVPRARVRAAGTGTDGAAADALRIGPRLGCRWVLSGSYQKAGPAIRILLELLHVPTERVTHTEKLDGRADDLFGLQDRIAQRIAEVLELGDRASSPPAAAPPTLGAYECYTRGLAHWNHLVKGGFERAQELMEEAIRQQPDYADALAGLAAVHAMRFTFTTDPLELAEALELTRRAIDAAPDHAPAHVWKAYALWRQERTEEAIIAIRRAAVLDPGNHQAPYFLACMLFSREEHAAALPYYQRAVEVGPTSGFAWLGLGSTHLELENFVEAEWSFRRAIELEDYGNHSTAGTAGYLGECLRRAGRLDEARASCLAGLEAVDRTDHMYRDSFRAVCLNALGRTALELGEAETARTAFLQCEQHLEGRPRTLGGGHLRCQARAGRAAADRDPDLLADARDAFARRDPGNWSWLWQCSADVTRRDLDRAAASLGLDPA